MQRVNIIGAGRVGRSFMTLLRDLPDIQLGDVASRSPQSARDAVARIGAGRARGDFAQMAPADLWLITVPDDQIASVAQTLSTQLRHAPSPAAPPTAIHFSGFLASDVLSPLRGLGWSIASCHPVRSFADPHAAAHSFAGTYCAIEGDLQAAAHVTALVTRLGAVPFSVSADKKPIYHAAAVFSNNFTTVLQAIALEAWRDAGVSQEVAKALCATLLGGTSENVARLGPADALTGPAARGDTEVLEQQEDAVAQFSPDAAKIYHDMSLLAERLKQTGSTLADAPKPAPSKPSAP